MAEAAEESGKENYRNGWPPDGRKFSEADRGDSAAREATEKENAAAAKLREEVCRKKSRILPRHPQHRTFLSGKMPVAARALLGLAGAVFFSGGRAFKRKKLKGIKGRLRRRIYD